VTRFLRGDDVRVSQIELFYDLVYVFAVTQLSHYLLTHRSADGALQAAVLLAMVWQVWVYTTWLTNYLDPDRQPVRLALVLLMLTSLVFAAALPYAFETRGTLIAVLYVVIQAGRSVFGIWATRGTELLMVFVRLLPWSLVAGVPMLAGAAVHGNARVALWAAAVAVELAAASIGFALPGVGGSRTTEWTIDGSHFAERCQAFVLIALGESVVVTGATLSGLFGPEEHTSFARYASFVLAFAGTVALWWVYFDTAAEDSARVIAESDDPGRLGRSAFHWVHPLIVAGIIVSAAADEAVLEDPTRRGVLTTSWLVVGGVALFLAGHAVFKALVWHVVSWSRVVAVVVLLALLAVAPHLTALALGIATLAVVVAVVIADRLQHPARLDVAPAR
jgi:low temperature requirement protein LtrA